ncbi:MAG TPA: hypothetical protein VJR58_07400 [Vineibacter sp.]|nr:hypothetical protein [Vineibacter sp.]
MSRPRAAGSILAPLALYHLRYRLRFTDPLTLHGDLMHSMSLSIRWMLLAGLFALFPMAASAQSLVVLNAELGQMVVTVCPTLESAQAQAALSRSWGTTAYDRSTAADHLHDKCLRVKATVVPSAREDTIAAFETWTMAYDRDSQTLTSAEREGVTYRIGVAIRKQTVAYYVGQLTLNDGSTFQGWIEIPNEPYLAKYLQEQKPG